MRTEQAKVHLTDEPLALKRLRAKQRPSDYVHHQEERGKARCRKHAPLVPSDSFLLDEDESQNQTDTARQDESSIQGGHDLLQGHLNRDSRGASSPKARPGRAWNRGRAYV